VKRFENNFTAYRLFLPGKYLFFSCGRALFSMASSLRRTLDHFVINLAFAFKNPKSARDRSSFKSFMKKVQENPFLNCSTAKNFISF
jgi:hypothetical protein